MKQAVRKTVFLTMLFSGSLFGRAMAFESSNEMTLNRQHMVETQLVARGIRDARVIEAMARVPRHLFLPEDLRHLAYEDGPVPIGHQQTISQPYIVAFMTEALRPAPGDRVLEIGTGSGYQAAVLAELVKEVYTVEIVEPLYREAKSLLEDLGYRNIHFKLGDGWQGWEDYAPFDKIMVTAASKSIPRTLIDQLKPGGRLVIPVGGPHDVQNLIVGEKHGQSLKTLEAIPVRFVPLIRGGQEPEEAEGDR